MSPTSCRFETAITEAPRARDWTPELREHRDVCPDCRQAAALCEGIIALADATADAAPAPRSAHALWLSTVYTRGPRAHTRTKPARLGYATGLAMPLLALLGFTLVRGAAGWARLSLSASALPSTQVAAAATVGLAVMTWVMSVGRRGRV